MLKHLYDRLAYAIIGFVLGAIIGAVLGYLYDFGASVRTAVPSIQVGLRQWILYGGGLLAAIGLVFGPSVGSVAGATSREVYEYETRENVGGIPGWVAGVVVLLAWLALAMWHFGASR